MSESLANLTKEVVRSLNSQIVVLDTETTGFNHNTDRIVEFGAIKLLNGKNVDSISLLVNPEIEIPQKTIDVHGITNEMVKNEPSEKECVPKIAEFISGSLYLVGHNVSFDIRFLEEMFKRNGYNLNCTYIDTCKFAKRLYKDVANHKLITLANYLNIPVNTTHRALADVELTVSLLRFLSWEVMKY